MRTQSSDTSPEMERVYLELLRQVPLSKRFAMMESWSQFLIEAARQAIRREYPKSSEQEVALILLTRQYGQHIADGVREHLARRRNI